MNRLRSVFLSFNTLPRAYIVWLVIIIGFLTYGRMLFNGFVGDDIGYINHPYIQQFRWLEFFKSGSADLGGTSPITGQFFRPLMLVVISGIYQVVGQAAFFYHLIQLLFHLMNVLLLFSLFRNYFSRVISLVLALVYLVHPINAETVAYISDLQDVLFVFFGLSALRVIFSCTPTKKSIAAVAVLLLLSLLSKETGILFSFSTIVVTLFSRPMYKKQMWIFALLPLLVYAWVRFFIASVWIGKVPHTIFGSLPLDMRLMNVPEIIWYYLHTVFYPAQLLFGQTWTRQPSFLSVVLLGGIGVIGIILLLKLRHDQYFRVACFFTAMLVMGLALHIQILPLEMTVADRWFYFPFIGLLGLIGIAVTKVPPRTQTIVIIMLILSLPILGVRTITRLADWQDSYTLYKHDSRLTTSYILEHSYGYELMQRGKMEEALPHLQKSIELFETTNSTNTLGVYYYKKNNLPLAISWFSRSIALGDNFLAFNNLARMYVTLKAYDKSQVVLERATKKFPQNPSLWYLLALTYSQRDNTVDALVAAEEAYTLAPTQQNYVLLSQLKAGLPIKITE